MNRRFLRKGYMQISLMNKKTLWKTLWLTFYSNKCSLFNAELKSSMK